MMTEVEMQSKFINENMDVLHKYLVWRETILPPQILDAGVEMPAIDTDVVDLSFMESGEQGKSEIKELKLTNYGIIN